MATPCGPFTIVTSDDAVIASGWTTSTEELMETVSAGAAASDDDAARRSRGGEPCGGATTSRATSSRSMRSRWNSTQGRSSSTPGTCSAAVPAGLADHLRRVRGRSSAVPTPCVPRRMPVPSTLPPCSSPAIGSFEPAPVRRAPPRRLPLGTGGEAPAARPRGRGPELSRVSDAVLRQFSEIPAMLSP